MVAGFLTQYGIPFTYERPTLVLDKGMPKIWYPDFSLDDYKILIDYLGIRADPKYHSSANYKSRVYAENKLDHISLTYHDLQKDWQHDLLLGIGQLIMERYGSFRKKALNSRG